MTQLLRGKCPYCGGLDPLRCEHCRSFDATAQQSLAADAGEQWHDEATTVWSNADPEKPVCECRTDIDAMNCAMEHNRIVAALAAAKPSAAHAEKLEEAVEHILFMATTGGFEMRHIEMAARSTLRQAAEQASASRRNTVHDGLREHEEHGV